MQKIGTNQSQSPANYYEDILLAEFPANGVCHDLLSKEAAAKGSNLILCVIVLHR